MTPETPQLNDHNKIAIQRVQKASPLALCRAIAISPKANRDIRQCTVESSTHHQYKNILKG